MKNQRRHLIDLRYQLWVPLGVILLSLLTSCSSTTSASTINGTTTPQSITQSATVQPDGLQKPAIPTTGAYIGAWVDPSTVKPDHADQEPGTNEIVQLPAFDQAIGTHVQILHVYTPFAKPLPVGTMNSIEQNGAIPLIDWGCDDLTKITNGTDDSTITAYAQAMKNFAKPVFLRWYWEMNLNNVSQNACSKDKSGPLYIAAWQHIWTIFHTVGANNVAFVWCPSGHDDAASYYPGDQYVDWIGIDYYDILSRNGTGATAVTSLFGSFYSQWSGHNKPLMIGETGARAANQAAYFQGLQTVLPSQYPNFKALMYFDAPGQAVGPWNLQGDGFSAFGALARSSYFSYGRQS